jgi:hypothetical protein
VAEGPGKVGPRSGRRQGKEPAWVESLEGYPVGRIGAGVVIAGWAVVILIAVFVAHWSLEVAFFVVVGWLTFVLGCMSLIAAIADQRRRGPTRLYKLEGWQDFEEYIRWLTPMAFVFGLVFAHYYWH